MSNASSPLSRQSSPRPRPRESSIIAARCVLAALLCLCAPHAAAQDFSPDRGFRPGGSYALSDIESINASNGNLMMNLPLASLPAGRAGSGGGISLVYNSKLYDSYGEYYEDWGRSPYPYVVQRTLLRPGDQGGWHYPLYYRLEVLNRMDNYGGPNSQYAPQYPDEQARVKYKVRIAFPDGSTHELFPQVPQWHAPLSDGYWDVLPNGYRTHWAGGSCTYTCVWAQDDPYYTGTMVYYSVDGTRLRLEVQHDSDFPWWNNPWTLYFPDGRKVTSGSQPQRTYDRNGNYTTFQEVTINGRPVLQMVDQVGRTVTLDQGVPVGQNDYEDHISTSGFGGAQLLWRVHWKTLFVGRSYGTVGLGDEYPSTLGFLGVVDRITLPVQAGSLTYTFGYNARDWDGTYTPSNGWGELSSVTLPSGARAKYQYVYDGTSEFLSWDAVLTNSPSGKDLVHRPEYDLAGPPSNTPCNPQTETCTTETWQFTHSPGVGGYGGGCATGPDGGSSCEANDGSENPIRSTLPDGTVVERIWAENRPTGYAPYFVPFPGVNRLANPYVKIEFTSIRDASGNLVKTAIKDFNHDKNGNVTQVREYDWVPYGSVPRNSYGFPTGMPASAPLKRVTANEYHFPVPDAADNTSHSHVYSLASSPPLLGALKSTRVGNGTQTLAYAEYAYDNPATTGNLTQKSSWDSAKGTLSIPLNASNSVTVSHQYDGYGNPTVATDARGVQTLLTYGSVGGHPNLYPTETRVAYGTPVQRTTLTQYNFSTGLVTRVTDADNGVATARSYDALGRPTLIKAADGEPVEARAATEYDDVLRRVVVRKDLNAVGDGKLISVQHFDQLGRVRLTRQLEDSASQSPYDETHGVKVQTRYLYSGQHSFNLVSNPYRSTYSHSAGGEAAMGWSRTKADSGGRILEVQTFNGAGLPAPWGSNASTSGAVTTAYDAEFTSVMDQAGKVRRSMLDVFGTLARIDEPDGGGNLGPATAPTQPTHYSYDALGNLTQVVQGQQTRTFVYSSLSRLLSATNPESGTVSYTYDPGGNLLARTDARNVTTGYAYDVLGRSISVDYLNTAVSPDIRRYYDNPTAGAYGRGLFWHDYKGDPAGGGEVEHRAVDYYDALGRPLVQRQLFKTNGAWGPTYQSSRTYNRAGGVATQTYPSGHAVSYTHDAAGRLAGLTGTLGDGAPRAYSVGIAYDEAGRLAREQFGTQTPLYHKRRYNARGQLFDVRLGLGADVMSCQRGALVLDYGTANNNGNVGNQQVWVPTDESASNWYVRQTNYSYDTLNRLGGFQEFYGSGMALEQWYAYDRYGNRQIVDWATNGANELQFEMGEAAAKNRLYAPGDLSLPEGQRRMRYDAAGSLTHDTYTGAGARSFDAEGRMTSAAGPAAFGGSYTNQYFYDADGRRTRRKVESGEVWQLYGMGDELMAEYAAGAQPSVPQKEYGYRGTELLVTAQASDAAKISAFVKALYQAVLNRQPAGAELESQVMTLTSAAFQGPTAFFNAASTAGRVLFQSQEYANRGRTDHWFVYDLFVAFLGREPDPGGWAAWEGAAASCGRACVLDAFSSGGNGEWAARAAAQANFVNWTVTDHLGTPRMVADKTGGLSGVRRHDYLPFGEEVGDGVGGRTAAQGYAPDNVRQKFTGYERDSETGLDYARARFYAPLHGRFVSADPLMSSARTPAPQTWNRYAYALNSPTRYTDPTGAFTWDESLGGDKSDDEVSEDVRKKRKRVRDALKEMDRLVASGTLSAAESKKLLRAVRAYGAEGTDNGVRLGVGQPRNPYAAGSAANKLVLGGDGRLSLSSQVLIREDSFDEQPAREEVTNGVLGRLNHEGDHVANSQDFVFAFNALQVDSQSGSRMAFEMGLERLANANLTRFGNEKSAFTTMSILMQASNYPGVASIGQGDIYRAEWAGWKEADRAAAREKGIEKALETSRYNLVRGKNEGHSISDNIRTR